MSKEALDDDYVAELLKQDAKTRSNQYSSLGLQAFLPQRSLSKAPKPNTRFLRNILRDTDNHNAALKAKEEIESKAKLKAFRSEQVSGLFSYSDNFDHTAESSNPAKRRRLDERGRIKASRGTTETEEHRYDKRRHHKRRGLERGRSSSRDRSRERSSKHRRRSRSRSESHERAYNRDRPSKRCHHHHSDSEYDRKPRSRSNIKKEEGRTSRHRHHHKRSRSPRRARSREDTRQRHTHRRRSSSRPTSESRSPEPSNYRKYDTGRLTKRSKASVHSAADQKRPQQSEESPSDSDPLEAIVGPAPPPKEPPIRSKGRGAFKSSLEMDAHFAPGYDPSTDVHADLNDQDEWGQAVEAFRDRARWKQQGAERLRAAGFTDDEIKKWEKGGEKNEDDVVWSKKGEGREWDRGKVLDEDGHIKLQADWGRLKGT